MITAIKKRRKFLALFFLTLQVPQFFASRAAYALTSGPTQPEVQGFQPSGATEMVDLFSGDFNYNIPLFELPGPNGGYPFNLSYQSGITMDQEASWVGLGFSLNPGAVNRQMRGFPDEFKGDPVFTKMSIAPSYTAGLGAGGGIEFLGGDINVGIGLSVFQNSYKGLGYSIDGSVGFQRSAGSAGTMGVGLGLSLNSQEGVNVNPSLDLGFDITAGTSYSSKEGLQNVSLTSSAKYKEKPGTVSGASVSSSLSLVHPGYTPQVSMPMNNTNLAAKVKLGGGTYGVFASLYVKGFYNEQKLRYDKQKVQSNAYGYLNYEYSANASDVLDFNREKDGIVTQQTPNLAIPSQTYDIYSVTGQGIGAMYRPMRNDYGIVRDPETSSESIGGSIGADLGPALAHIGLNAEINHSRSTSGTWDGDNDMRLYAGFQKSALDDSFEPSYFKVHGEPATRNHDDLSSIGGEEPVRAKLSGSNGDAKATNEWEDPEGNHGALSGRQAFENTRQPRSQVIQPITNEQLLKGSDELLAAFQVNYLGKDESPESAGNKFDRASHEPHHLAGFTALNPDGLRYNYTIPAYNLNQEETIFSAKRPSNAMTTVDVCPEGGCSKQEDPAYSHTGTEKLLKRVELPAYAHAYMLTSIVGPDYVDVTNDGVTPDDLGYWVRFTYRKTTTDLAPYKWRDPFSGAHYMEGYKTDPRDDKGSYTYGEKEIWYLARAETKSHIATFTVEARTDALGVNQKLQDQNTTGSAQLYRLKEIKLYSSKDANGTPIKKVRFEYDYSQCMGIVNSGTNEGKLTLKKVWFEYGGSERGSLNPYEFTYSQSNPNYDQHAYDRWGNYKPHDANDVLSNVDFPYVNQNPSEKEQLDLNVSSWTLKEMKLPSGGKVIVDYETDDYGYVQHLPAMQMTELVDPYAAPAQASQSTEIMLSNEPKVRFKLEKPIEGTLSDTDQAKEVLKYLDQVRQQVYFKIKINIQAPGKGAYEYVSGYADIEFNNTDKPMKLEKDATGKYVYGSFYLKLETADNHHPFSVRAWQHLRTNQPDLASGNRQMETSTSDEQKLSKIKSMAGLGEQIKQMFSGFNDYCNNKQWGRQMQTGKSWIRLESPDHVKYGGGLRVRQVTMKDNWATSDEGVYGQVYDYTIEENGEVISSGVAAYEPIIGGDENPHRYAKKFVESVPLKSSNNLYFEYPVNESYYPGAQVGYRQVTTISLAAASLAGMPVKNIQLAGGKTVFPQGEGIRYGTTGKTVHEFYTAKEFPIIADETEKKSLTTRYSVLIPYIGSTQVSKMVASQGYSVMTNDMHGKVKKISNYSQDKSGQFPTGPSSWVQYNYSSRPRSYQQQQVYVPFNAFKDNKDGTLSKLNNGETDPDMVTLGQETEFFFDMRESLDETWGGGGSYNTDFFFVLFGAIPAVSFWGNASHSTQRLRTSVANKIIFKAGILESTKAFDGGSTLLTENVKWDKLTGAPVLTKVNNNFDSPLYHYSQSAYLTHQGMGGAYQNIGLKFSVFDIQKVPYRDDRYEFHTNLAAGMLQAGDEFLLYEKDSEFKVPFGKAVYVGKVDGHDVLCSDTPTLKTAFEVMIVRSGFRNQLTVSAGTITALEDPSVKGNTVTYSKTITTLK